MIAAIVGARDRASLKDRFDSQALKDGLIPKEAREAILGKDRLLVEKIIDNLIEKYGYSIAIITVGCDDGIGMLVKETALKKRVGFIEVSVHFHGEKRPRPDYTKFYLARNATILELVEVAIVLISSGKQSVTDDIVERIKRDNLTQSFVVLNESGMVVDKSGDDMEKICS